MNDALMFCVPGLDFVFIPRCRKTLTSRGKMDSEGFSLASLMPKWITYASATLVCGVMLHLLLVQKTDVCDLSLVDANGAGADHGGN